MAPSRRRPRTEVRLDGRGLHRHRRDALRRVHEHVEAIRNAAAALDALTMNVHLDADADELAVVTVAAEAAVFRMVVGAAGLLEAFGVVGAITGLDAITLDGE